MSEKIFTIPNILGITRILIAPIIMWLIVHHYRSTALIITSFAFFTDLIDGRIARKFDQITNLGKSLDPVADKFLLSFILLGVCVREGLDFWLLLFSLLIAVYFFGYIFIYPLFIKKGLHISNFGKCCVFINCFVVLFSIYNFHIYLMYAITVLLVAPQLSYLLRFIFEKRRVSTGK